MNKTIKALDDFLASIISLIPSWLGMLKSTRTLTAIGTTIAVYYTAVHSGLSGTDALIAYVVEAATGITLVVGKTIRSGTPAANGTDTSVPAPPLKIKCPNCGKMVDDRTWCSECDWVLHPTIPPSPKYIVPPSLAEKGADKPTAFQRWLALDEMMNWDLTQHDPQVRMEFASDILRENKIRLDATWIETLQGTDVKSKDIESATPTVQDFETYEATQAFKKKTQDITPGCEWLTINQDTMMRGYGRCFKGFLWVSKLFEKSINWHLAHSVNELVEYGYGAVLT